METNGEKTAFKNSVKAACIAVLELRMHTAELAMQNAQDSANNQEKSSAGDKYETSRAMGQIDRDMNARQLQEAKKDLLFLKAVNIAITGVAANGSIIEFGDNLFFIAIGLGAVKVDDRTVMAVSYKSPLFELLKNKKAGDKILFQGREQEIISVI